MNRRAAMSHVCFDTVPLDYQDHPARILDAGKKLDAAGTRGVGLKQGLTEYSLCTRRAAPDRPSEWQFRKPLSCSFLVLVK
jgi:hypothetical protein